MAIKHNDGCPKNRVEKRTRSFFRGGDQYTAEVSRCNDCGQSDAAKSKKVKEG